MSDYAKYFVNGETGTDLRACPCCGAPAEVHNRGDTVMIGCSRNTCKIVEGKTMKDAVELWNEKRFTEVAA